MVDREDISGLKTPTDTGSESTASTPVKKTSRITKRRYVDVSDIDDSTSNLPVERNTRQQILTKGDKKSRRRRRSVEEDVSNSETQRKKRASMKSVALGISPQKRKDEKIRNAKRTAIAEPSPLRNFRPAEGTPLKDVPTQKTKAFSSIQSKMILAARMGVFGRYEHKIPKHVRKKKKMNNSRIPYTHYAAKGWSYIGRVSTLTFCHYIDAEENDYAPHEYHVDDSVAIEYIGHPMDRPKDIRARPWFVVPRQGSIDLNPETPVFRAVLRCIGNCDPMREDSDATEQDSDADGSVEEKESDSVASATGSEEDDSKADVQVRSASMRNKRKYRHKCTVKLHIEVHAGDLGAARIYRYQKHERVRNVTDLKPSQYVRHYVKEKATFHSMTASHIKQSLELMYHRVPVPRHRRPSNNDIRNIVQQCRKAERMDTDPLRSIGVFAEAHPECIFNFWRPTVENGHDFSTGIKDDFSTQSLIAHARKRGIGLDSSYRHKNENRAPVTFITTMNEHEHMLPGTVYISSDIKTTTIETFLRETKKIVEDHALDLVEGRAQVHPSHEDVADLVMEEAKHIVKYGWEPAFVMIDKSMPNRDGILKVWPRMRIRVCQFHVVQAICRWDGDSDRSSTARPELGRYGRQLFFWAFRELQRCAHMLDWERDKELFAQRLDIVVSRCRNPRAAKRNILAYLEANWYRRDWLPYWTDMGLPKGKYRDGGLSTNNWTERAFKSFDQIFLRCRANKSIFRLVLIFVNDWFPYFTVWENKERPCNDELEKRERKAFDIWNTKGAVQRIGNTRSFKVANISTEDENES